MDNIEKLLMNARELASTNWLKAVNFIRDGIANNPEEPALYELMGDIYLQKNVPNKSIDLYKLAINSGGSNQELIGKTADAYLMIDDFISSLKYFDMLEDLPIHLVHKKVFVLHRLNRFNDAINLLDEYIGDSPYPETFIQYIEILAQSGQFKKALEYVKIGRLEFDNDARIIALGGIIQYMIGENYLACKAFNQVERKLHDTAWRLRYIYIYARAAINAGFYEKGITLLEDYILKINTDIDAFRFYLIALENNGEVSRAIQLIKKLETKPDMKEITLTTMKVSLNYYLKQRD